MTSRPDPLVGAVVADRYEIVELINVGGMGAVYRAVQRSLDRPVAIKFIHSHLLTSEISVQRFMAEARALSRMNHPHVVSVFDFGRTAPEDGGRLYLVMEYLTGRDLGDVLVVEPLLPIPRVVNIVLQVLAGLGEAHHLGITHRDVKPENVILEPTRSGRDHAMLIDFGIARVETGRRITETGTVCGTPLYMAPEQATGAAGPSADLYSVGVMLFQMLTSELPAMAPPRRLVAGAGLTAPDPREVAPGRGIPEALARVCLRALSLLPEQRFPSAQAFDEALRDAMTSTGDPSWTRLSWPSGDRVSWPSEASARRSSPPGSGKRVSDTLPAQAKAALEVVAMPVVREGRGTALAWAAPSQRGEVTGEERGSGLPREPLFGRAAELAWARELLAAERPPPALAFWGRAGVGRTRLVREVAAAAEREQALVVPIALAPAPHGEVGYRGLRHVLQRLSGRSAAELLDDPSADRWAQTGMRLLFSTSSRAPSHASTTRRAAAAALGWCMSLALARSPRGRVLLVIDDLDRLDGASHVALWDHLRREPVPGVTTLVASEHAQKVFLPGVREHALRGLSAEDAGRMLASLGGTAALPRADDDVEPLYVEQLAAANGAGADPLPETLEGIVEHLAQGLTAQQRRILQAIWIVGTYDVQSLGALLRLPGDTRTAIAPLVERGWVKVRGRDVTLRHAVFGRVVADGAPADSAPAIHKAAAHALRHHRDLLELRAYHAIQGPADFEAFLLLEEVARVRGARGDVEGAIAALSMAVAAARVRVMHGETEAASAALVVFGRKLAAALVSAGRPEEAQGVLDEILHAGEPTEAARAAVLEQLAAVVELRGRGDEAARRRREALAIAERAGEQKLAERLRAALSADPAARPKASARAGFGVPAALAALPDRARPSVLVVEDDASIREGIQALLKQEGHHAFGAVNGRDALDLLHRIPRPGLILVDLMMPVMNGWELLEALRAEEAFASIPVVVVSAARERDKLTGYRVLRKPLEVSTLLKVVEEFC